MEKRGLESELWGGGLERRACHSLLWIEWHWGGYRFFLLSLNCLFLLVSHAGSEIEGREGCRVGQEDRGSSAEE